MYIEREMESLLKQMASEYSAVLVTGPRQVGKSTMLKHAIDETGGDVELVTLDDIPSRRLAKEDPAMFFQIHEPPVMVDEVQYAPELFVEIKKRIDAGAPAGSFLLTGSQRFRLMELAGESLAGRVAILSLSSLLQREIAGTSDGRPFCLDTDYWKTRVRKAERTSVSELFNRIQKGAMPALASGKFTNAQLYYSSYVQTYIERDVHRLAGNVDALKYEAFMRSVAARCSQELNVAAIARDAELTQAQVRDWLAVLERSGIIFYLHPYSNNQLKRTVKSPKLYFHDCGIVAYFTRWTSGETMEAGAMAGAFVENFVVSEIYKSFENNGIEPPLWYYRDRDAKEIDIVIESDGELHPIEIKKTASPTKHMTKNFSVLNKASVPVGTGAVVCMAEDFGALDAKTLVIPIWAI